MRIIHALAMATALMHVACGGESPDETDQPKGTAPAIEALTFDPKTVDTGKQSVLTGQFAFRDAESDADRFAAAITLPDGSRQSLPPSGAQGTAGRTEGQVAFLVAVAPPTAGTYTFELWMLDAADHESNHLDGTFEATAPP